MNSFIPIARDIRENQINREALPAQPPEFFLTHYGAGSDATEKLSSVEKIAQAAGASQIFANDVYWVQVRKMPPFIQLNIARHDGQPCTNLRDFLVMGFGEIRPE